VDAQGQVVLAGASAPLELSSPFELEFRQAAQDWKYMITSRAHGIIDYVVAIALLLAPVIFGFADGRTQYATQALGAAILLMSLVTAYEFSVTKVIPYSLRLGVDVIVGSVILLSPWLFRFSDKVRLPHVVVGVISLLVVAFSWRGATTNGCTAAGTSNR
jgi:hypothetical protein